MDSRVLSSTFALRRIWWTQRNPAHAFALAALLIWSPVARAQDEPVAVSPASETDAWESDTSDESEWDDEAQAKPKKKGAIEPGAGDETVEVDASPSALSFEGYLRSRSGLWTERFSDNPFAQSRQSADLALRYRAPLADGPDAAELRLVAAGHVEYDLAYRHERDSYDTATIDTYEWQIIGGETYVGLSWGPTELTLGRQIVTWGEGEILSPLNIVNPRDLREPGLTEPEDLRLAVLMSRLGLYFGRHAFETMVIHEPYFGLVPAPLSDFSPYRALLIIDEPSERLLTSANPSYAHIPERFGFQAHQFLQSWSYTGEGFDLALYAASIFEEQGIPVQGAVDTSVTPLEVPMEHPRYTMVGHSGALPVGDFVLRWELGADIERPFAAIDTDIVGFNMHTEFRHQLFGMLGFLFSGLDDGTIAFEYSQAYVIDHPERDPALPNIDLFWRVEQPIFAARWMHFFLDARLQTLLGATAFGIPGGQELGLDRFRGWAAKAEVTYAIWDPFRVGLGYITYQPPSLERDPPDDPHPDDFGPIYGFDDHDRLYLTLRWDFFLD